MGATLLIGLLVVLAILVNVKRRARALPPVAPPALPEPRRPMYIADDATNGDTRSQPRPEREDSFTRERRREANRLAAAGDLGALAAAHEVGDPALYAAVVDTLLDAGGPDAPRAIGEQIVASGSLRATVPLARAAVARWEGGPTRASLASTLHVAALADDAAVFDDAVAAAERAWRRGDLEPLPGDDLVALLESSYWLMTNEARSAGAAFVAKRHLSLLRREVAAGARSSTPNADVRPPAGDRGHV